MPKDYLIVIPKNRENKGFSIKYNFDQLKFDVSSCFLNQYCSGIINLKDKKIIQSTVDCFIKIPNECSIDLLLAPYISTPDDLNLNSQLLQSAFEKNIKSFEFYQKNVYSNPILLFIKDLIEHNTTLNKLYLQVYGQEELKEILKMLPNQHNLCMVTIRVIGQVSDKEIYDLCMNYKQKSLSTIIHFWEFNINPSGKESSVPRHKRNNATISPKRRQDYQIEHKKNYSYERLNPNLHMLFYGKNDQESDNK